MNNPNTTLKKICDDFYTLEFSEERTIPDVEGVDLDRERELLWDDVNYSVVKLDHLVESTRFKFNDFLIIKEDE